MGKSVKILLQSVWGSLFGNHSQQNQLNHYFWKVWFSISLTWSKKCAFFLRLKNGWLCSVIFRFCYDFRFFGITMWPKFNTNDPSIIPHSPWKIMYTKCLNVQKQDEKWWFEGFLANVVKIWARSLPLSVTMPPPPLDSATGFNCTLKLLLT